MHPKWLNKNVQFASDLLKIKTILKFSLNAVNFLFSNIFNFYYRVIGDRLNNVRFYATESVFPN